jgi:VWFA-related protein
MRPFLLVLTLLVATAAQEPPKPPPAPAPQQPVFRTGVNLVRVDVTVTDTYGRPVPDLAAEDFDVSEDDVPQVVESFKLVEVSGEQAPGDDLSLPIRSPEHAATEAARDDVRLFAIFLDDYHVSRMGPTITAKAALSRFVRELLRPTDVIAIMDPLTPLSALRFTRDRATLLDRIKTFEGRRGIFFPARSVLEEQQMLSRNPTLVRAEVTMSALEALVTHLGSLREGRKAVILVSEGFPIYSRSASELSDRFRNLVRAANRNNTAIYGVHPGGLGLRSFGSDTLRVLAVETGGRAIVDTNDPMRGLQQLVRDSSAYYLLGYASSSPLDGKYHKIRVRLKRRGLNVHARQGYWAPSAAETARVAAAAAANRAPAPVSDALTVFASPTGNPLHTWVGLSRVSDTVMRVTFASEHRRDAHVSADNSESRGGRPALRVRLTAYRPAAEGAEGTFFYDDLVPADGPDGRSHVSFEAPPGPLKLSITIENEKGEGIDREIRTIEVREPAETAVSLSTPRVYRTASSLEVRQLAANPDPVPNATRDFDRRDRLQIRLEAHTRSGVVPAVTATLLNRQGKTLTQLPVRAIATGFELDLPLSALAPADYVVRFDARAGEASASEHLALRVR